MVKIEICIDSVASALVAAEARADRVELCAGLVEGGVTPSPGMIKRVRGAIKIPLFVLIRPRGGDFLYDDEELEIIKEDIRFCKECGCDGVVIGLLKEDGSVDIPRTRELVELALPMQVTFHRAFDMAADPFQALRDIQSIHGIQRILTSGHDKTALDGLPEIAELIKRGSNTPIIVPGGGITEKNAQRIVEGSGATEIHLSARSKFDSKMKFRNPNVSMGGQFGPPEFSVSVADSKKISGVQSLFQ